MVPALADVGALRGFADGVEVERAGQLFEVVVVVAHGRAGSEPLRLGEQGGAARGRSGRVSPVSWPSILILAK